MKIRLTTLLPHPTGPAARSGSWQRDSERFEGSGCLLASRDHHGAPPTQLRLNFVQTPLNASICRPSLKEPAL